MERKMRRDDRALTEAEAQAILQAGEYGVLSTVSVEGQPYGVPVSYAYTGEAIYFHCAPEGHKLDNVNSNDRVSFCVVGRTQVLPDKFATNYESVIVFGTAHEVVDDEKHAGLVKILKKYSPDFMAKGERYIANDGPKARVYKIVIQSLTGKARR